MITYNIRQVSEKDAEALIDYMEELSQEPEIPLPLTPGCITLTLDAERDYLRGRRVTLELGHERVSGVAKGIAADGALLVKTAEGEAVRYCAGDIHVSDVSA